MSGKNKEGKAFWRVFVSVVSGFFLNLLWELLHSLLYNWNKPPLVNDVYVYIPRIVFFASGFLDSDYHTHNGNYSPRCGMALFTWEEGICLIFRYWLGDCDFH